MDRVRKIYSFIRRAGNFLALRQYIHRLGLRLGLEAYGFRARARA